jgi:ankyrin repeat protein
MNGHEAVVKLLVEKGANLESKGGQYSQTPLSLAALNGHEAVVKLLVEKGANLESKDDCSQTFAAMKRHEAVVKLLVKKGADLECKDRYGWTPPLLATNYGHKAVVKLRALKNLNK